MKSKFNFISNSNLNLVTSIKFLICLFTYILVIRIGYAQDYAQNINISKPRLKKFSHLHSANCNHHHESDKNVIDNSGSNNKKTYNTRKKFNQWVLNEEREGVKIYYKWLRGKEFMLVRVDNLSDVSKSVYFQPLVYCWQCIDNSSNEQMHVKVGALSSTNAKVRVKCEHPMDTDMKLEDLYIYND